MAKQIGQILMESGMINIDDLNEALEIQKSSSQKLGEILISMGAITPEELEMILEFQSEEQ
jgi:type IV pilus assembly protein PilB